MLTCGDTFLLPKSADAVEHLWIVLTDPDPQSNQAVCVNVTTRQSHSETTVVLQPGDHPFIRHESVVHYADADFLNMEMIDRVLSTTTKQRFVCQPHARCSPELLKRIQNGLLASKLAKRKIKDYCFACWS